MISSIFIYLRKFFCHIRGRTKHEGVKIRVLGEYLGLRRGR